MNAQLALYSLAKTAIRRKYAEANPAGWKPPAAPQAAPPAPPVGPRAAPGANPASGPSADSPFRRIWDRNLPTMSNQGRAAFGLPHVPQGFLNLTAQNMRNPSK